jgi:hypothetical protein
MYPLNVQVLQADALFASALQRSDELNVSRIRQAIAAAIGRYGAGGCAGRVAQEFGDHPESAATRMRWAQAAVAVLQDQLVPKTRWRDVGSCALGGSLAAGLSASSAMPAGGLH